MISSISIRDVPAVAAPVGVIGGVSDTEEAAAAEASESLEEGDAGGIVVHIDASWCMELAVLTLEEAESCNND